MRYIITGALALMAASVVISSCKKNELRSAPFEFTDGKALVKINHSCPYSKNPGIVIKVNGEKVSSPITYSTPYPGGGLNTGGNSYADYLAFNPGDNKISLTIPFVGTNNDSIVLHEATYNVKANVYQTIHFTDTLQNTVGVTTIDASNKPDSGYTEFRFVNLIPNSTGIDLYFGPDRVAANVPYKGTTEAFLLPAGNSLAWTLRDAGGTTTLGTAYTSASTVANQRVFTVYARGYRGLVTTDIRSPKISFVYNK
jgi:hypothetical protein